MRKTSSMSSWHTKHTGHITFIIKISITVSLKQKSIPNVATPRSNFLFFVKLNISIHTYPIRPYSETGILNKVDIGPFVTASQLKLAFILQG
jgi:hypothetical protein